MTNGLDRPVPNDVDALRHLAVALARRAGDLARDGRDAQRRPTPPPGSAIADTPAASTIDIMTKSSITDLVTEHDRAAERLLVEALHRTRPHDGIVGEEGANVAGTSGYDWFVDPIDGTTNFVYGHPMWATSVAVGDDQGMVAGAVYAPDSGEMFAAARGAGATLDGRPIVASSIEALELALVATGFSYEVTTRVGQARVAADLIGDIRDIRRSGSAALDLCYVAAGRLDGYFERPLNVWDLAAGELIAREAGCRSTSFDGSPPSTTEAFVAAPGIFDPLRLLVARAVL